MTDEIDNNKEGYPFLNIPFFRRGSKILSYPKWKAEVINSQIKLLVNFNIVMEEKMEYRKSPHPYGYMHGFRNHAKPHQHKKGP